MPKPRPRSPRREPPKPPSTPTEQAFERFYNPSGRHKALGGVPPLFVPGAEVRANAFRPFLNGLITIPDGSLWRIEGMHNPEDDAQYGLPAQVDDAHWRVRLRRVDDAEKPGRWSPDLIAVTPDELGQHFAVGQEQLRPALPSRKRRFDPGHRSKTPRDPFQSAEPDESLARAPAIDSIRSMPGEAVPLGPYEDPEEQRAWEELYGRDASGACVARTTRAARLPSLKLPSPRQAKQQLVWGAINSLAASALREGPARREASHDRAFVLEGLRVSGEFLRRAGFVTREDGVWVSPVVLHRRGCVRLVATPLNR